MLPAIAGYKLCLKRYHLRILVLCHGTIFTGGLGITHGEPVPLWDRYGRPLLNVRLAVTLRCNFRCFFCHLEGLQRENREEMKPYDYLVLALAARKIGIRSFKLTGGEPLLRKDILDVISALEEGHPNASISITTNGYLLDIYAPRLAEHKISHVNVSLHSLEPARFQAITGVDGLERVTRGLRIAAEYGLRIKINTVILRGLNEDELEQLLDFAAKLDAEVHLIELHPVGIQPEIFHKYHLPHTALEAYLEKRATKIEYRLDLHNRKIYVLDNGVRVELIGPTGNPVFCAGCTRVRVSPYGEMTPCLNRGNLKVEFLSKMRRATSLEEAVDTVIDAFRRVNMLREPFYMYRVNTPIVSGKRRRSFRIYLPKKNGVIDARVESLLLREWLED